VLGRHLVADLRGCPRERIATVAAVERPFLRAVAASGARLLSHASRQFEPEGATVVALLAESHASLHTWPEHGYAGVDFFSCSPEMDAALTVRMLAEALGAEAVDLRTLDRGVRP
jgi:S-adenosylmethionine decarboxylase proenzyme